jgi:hypothetical protein
VEPQHFTLEAAVVVFIKAPEVQVLAVPVVVVMAATRQLEEPVPMHQQIPAAVVVVDRPALLHPQVTEAVV